jgi:hypothetical protein
MRTDVIGAEPLFVHAFRRRVFRRQPHTARLCIMKPSFMVHMSSRMSAQPRNMKQKRKKKREKKTAGASRAAVKSRAAGSATCFDVAALDGRDPLAAFPFLKSIVAEKERGLAGG